MWVAYMYIYKTSSKALFQGSMVPTEKYYKSQCATIVKTYELIIQFFFSIPVDTGIGKCS